jgi:hypothetical protein
MDIFTTKTTKALKLCLLPILFFGTGLSLEVSAQTLTNYSFTPTSGTFVPVAPAPSPIYFLDGDDSYVNSIPINFDFWYMGTRYTTISACTNGWITLGTDITNPQRFNNLRNGISPGPVIAPLWDDLKTTGYPGYATSGTAPNRVFTVEYLNMRWFWNAASPSVSFQIKLYETSGKVEFIYRPEAGGIEFGSSSIGISSTGASPLNFLSVNKFGTDAVVSSTTETYDIGVKPASGLTYTFTPPGPPIAPANLTISSVGATAMTLNWTQTSTNEVGFAIFRSADGGATYSYINRTSANATSSIQTGLNPGTSYYWKVYAVTEGWLSTAVTGNQCTLNDAKISYSGSPYCLNSGTASVTRVGSAPIPSGTYSSTAGLSINAATGSVDLNASVAGTYTVTYTIAAGACSLYTTTAVITVNTTPQLSLVSTSNIIGRYNFTGNATDFSGTNNGALQNAPSLGADRFSNLNAAYNFNGTNQYVSTANPYTNPPVFTISVWFKTNTTTGGKLVGFGNVQTGAEANYDRHIYMDDSGKIYFGVFAGGIAEKIKSTLSYNNGAWHQAIASLSAGGMALYIDGGLIATNTSVTVAENYAGYWRIGYGSLLGWASPINPPTSPYFSGALDDVHIYHRALSAIEISSLYNNSSQEIMGNTGPVCSGSPVTLISPSVMNATYSWSGPGAAIPSVQKPTFIFAASNAGLYTVTVTAGGCSSTASTIVSASTTAGQWIGKFSTDWNLGNNWCNGAVPGASADITIPAATTFMPILTGNVTCNNIALNTATANLSLATSTLTINGLLSGTGKLIGSATAGLVIGGAGTTGYPISFDQTSSASRTLLNYTQSRDATITLANSVEVTNLMKLTGTSSKVTSNGNLTLISTATQNANVGVLPTGASITGDVTVQTFMLGGANTRGYQSLSSPVHTSVIGVTPQTYTPSLYKKNMFVTGPLGVLGEGLPNVFDKGVNDNWTSSTVRYYSEPDLSINSQYTYPATITEPRTVGKGLYFYFRGDRAVTAMPKIFRSVGNVTFATPENVTAELIGVINSGTYAVPVTKTNHSEADDGFNLIGNPYPSIVDWNNLYSNPGNSTVVAKNIYTIRKDGSIAIYDGTTGPQIFGGSQYVLPGQGFFVRAIGTGDVIFQESNKSTVSPVSAPSPGGVRLMSAGAVKTQTSSELQYLRLTIKKDSLYADETVIAFRAGSSALLNEEDSRYFTGTNVILYTLSADNQNLAINYMPEISEVKEVKLFVNALLTGEYSLNLSEFGSINGTDILLYDKLTNSTINLTSQLKYSFSIDKNAVNTYGAERFKLLFEPVPPPISLVSFSAKKVNAGSELKWTTKSEQNTDRFEVERSEDGKSFTGIGQIKDAGAPVTNKSYQYLDKSPTKGINYYRLKQVYADGKFNYSTVVFVKYDHLTFGNPKANLTVYPNPSRDEINIDLSLFDGQKLRLDIFNSEGKRMKTDSFIAQTLWKQRISDLKNGIYIIKIYNLDANQLIGREKFVKY